MFDVEESPTGNTKVDRSMMDPLVFPSLPLVKGIGHNIQGSWRSVSSTSHDGVQLTSWSSSPRNHSVSHKICQWWLLSSRPNAAHQITFTPLVVFQAGTGAPIEAAAGLPPLHQTHLRQMNLHIVGGEASKRWASDDVVQSGTYTRKCCDRDSWENCLRLVNDKAVSADAYFSLPLPLLRPQLLRQL